MNHHAVDVTLLQNIKMNN